MRTSIFREHKGQILISMVTIMIVAGMLFVNHVLASPDNGTALSTLNNGLLSYQGTLVDSNGNPVEGDKDITFRIYNHPTDLSYLWEEAHIDANSVPIHNGLFNVMLGSFIPIPDTVWNEAELYLGVKVGSDPEMSPREIISFVPYARNAGIAQSVPVGSLNSSHVNFTSGSKMATEDIELTPTYQIIPGMEATITVNTPQTLFISFTVYFVSSASSGYGTARIRISGENGTFTTPLIVKSWPATDTCSKSYLIDLPAGTYTIQAQAKSYSGEAFADSAWTNMIWFAFSQ